MPTTARRGDSSGRPPSGLDPRFGHLVLTHPGKRRVLPSLLPGPRWPPQVAGGRRGEPRAFGAPPSRLSLCPRASRAIPGRRRAEAGPAAGSPLIVRGGGGGGGGGGAAEPRQDVAEAVVAVQLGLALGALDGALEAAAEEALRAGRQEGEGEVGLARRRVRDPRGTRAPARRPRGRGRARARPWPCSSRPAPPACRPSADGPARAERPSPPPRHPPVRQPASCHVAPPPKPLLPWRRRAGAAPAATEDARRPPGARGGRGPRGRGAGCRGQPLGSPPRPQPLHL